MRRPRRSVDGRPASTNGLASHHVNASGHASASTGIAHLLVVAGPSGAGKSVFLRQLESGRLGETVDAFIPRGCEGWLQLRTGGSKFWFPHFSRCLERTTIPGAILHFDITGKKLLEGDFSSDPARDLFRLSKQLTVVNLNPPAAQLVEHLERRQQGAAHADERRSTLGGRAAEIGYLRLRAIAGLLPRRIMLQMGFLQRLYRAWNACENHRNGQRRHDRETVAAKIAQYRQRGWLDAAQARWQAYIQFLIAEGADVRQVFLEPDGEVQGEGTYRWRINQAAAPATARATGG